MDADERRFNVLTRQIIGAAFSVSSELGVGCLEKVYENAPSAERTMRGPVAHQQVPIKACYKNVVAGDDVADPVVENLILVELKHCEHLGNAHLAQRINDLKVTGMKICLLINFGKEQVESKRVVSQL